MRPSRVGRARQHLPVPVLTRALEALSLDSYDLPAVPGQSAALGLRAAAPLRGVAEEDLMRYEMLGNLRVVSLDGPMSVTARKVETLLAVLLVRADQVVSMSQLTEEIWGERQPRCATAAVHVYVSQLRKFLADAQGAAAERGRGPVITRASGYALQVTPGQVDVHEFQDLVGQGRGHARSGRHREASQCFGAALGLWRGPALDGLVDRPVAREFATWADEARLECVELQVESDLSVGRHRELIARLRGLVSEYPLREGFARQLMIALSRAERRGEAMKVYQEVSRTFERQLGLEPGRPLQELYRACLLTESSLNPRLGTLSPAW